MAIAFFNFRFTMDFLDGSFPNLKKLYLTNNSYIELQFRSFRQLHFDLSRFADTLEELKLESVNLSDCQVKSFACLKNLKVLSLPFTKGDLNYFIESLRSMTNLR